MIPRRPPTTARRPQSRQGRSLFAPVVVLGLGVRVVDGDIDPVQDEAGRPPAADARGVLDAGHCDTLLCRRSTGRGVARCNFPGARAFHPLQ